MTQNDNRPGPGQNYGETAIFTFGRKVLFLLKMGFNPKKHPKFLKRLIFIWEKASFFFEQLFPVVVRTWLESRGFFLGPKSRLLAKKSNFCHTTSILVIGTFVALRETVHFPPWERFFDFSFWSYSRFCKKTSQ